VHDVSRTVRSNLIVLFVVGLALVAVLLLQLPDQPPPTRIDTITAPSTVEPRTRPTVPVPVDTLGSARARRDAALFSAWVTAVAARPLPALPHPCPDDVERIIRDVFAGTGEEDFFVGIAWRESRCQPWARNPNGGQVDSGVFQLRMPLHAARVAGCDVFDARCNVLGARSLFDECGRGPWDKAGGYWCSPPG